ncbi:acyl-CoA-like ligand-binding transcription factor [Kineococcus sp. SYSU DK001]|uniref:acyl-CoA-like ligand-binding transcription factor n=1 Tax=Kineococcus sp. SYSU DK001 TaxID=3383122 RepID=UPI003D7D03A9
MTEQPVEKTAPRRGRPPASSREEIETVAIELFLSKGFEETTLAEITAAARVSKTSFFRYFPSKGSIIWWRFDEFTAGFAELLETALPSEDATLDLVRSCIIGALERVIDPDGLWMQRFRVLDESTELRSGESEQWAAWTEHVASFVARRHGFATGDVAPQAVAGGVHGAYVAMLRRWLLVDDPGRDLLPELDRELQPLSRVLQSWLDESPAA